MLQRLPHATTGDLAYNTFRGLLSAVPLAGGVLAEWFSHFLAPPLSRRRDEWLRSLAEGLAALEGELEAVSVEGLQHNEAFVTATMQATAIALRTQQREKLEALRNAVLNAAIGRTPDEDLQTMFLQFVDTFTTWHVRILSFFRDPSACHMRKQYSMGAPAMVLEEVFPELRGGRTFYDQLVRDLHARGLFTLDSLHTTMSESGMYAKRTTELADRFLDFISSPLPAPHS